MNVNVEARAEELFVAHLRAMRGQTDRLMAALMVAQWIFAIAIAVIFSPYAWEGAMRSIHVHVLAAAGLGAAISSLPIVLALTRPGDALTRHVIAVAQMSWSALLIHLTGGRVETHFHIFGSLAFLAFYRDAWVLLPATIVVAGDHVIRQFLWPESVYGAASVEWWRFLEHAAWVLFEDVFLVIACARGITELRDIARQRAELELLSDHERQKERLERELEIASRLQTALLPSRIVAPGLEVAARMDPASEVGGDYYDVLPRGEQGAWIAIGDVAGHGLPAGVVMLMVRTAFAALVERDPDASPSDILTRLNRIVHEAVKERLRTDEHVTLCVLRYDGDGRFVHAGAHEDIVVFRAATGRCERIATSGAWIAVAPEIAHATMDQTFVLEANDAMYLMTDGLFEAETPSGTMLGVEMLVEAIEADAVEDDVSASGRLGRLLAYQRDAVREREDDVTLMVVRRAEGARALRVSDRSAERVVATAAVA